VIGALKASSEILVPGITTMLPFAHGGAAGATHSRERQTLRSPRSQQVMPGKAGRHEIDGAGTQRTAAYLNCAHGSTRLWLRLRADGGGGEYELRAGVGREVACIRGC
jgi:hypothetical protein